MEHTAGLDISSRYEDLNYRIFSSQPSYKLNRHFVKLSQICRPLEIGNSGLTNNFVYNLQCMHVCMYVLLTIKPTRCTNFSNLFLEQNSTCFGQFLCPSSTVFSLYTQQWYVVILLLCVQ